MCGGTHEGTRKNHGNFTEAEIGWEEGDTRLRESQPVSFREKDERSSSKGSWRVREKDGRIIREGKGHSARTRWQGEGKGTRRRETNVAGERGRKCGWNGNEGRWRCSEDRRRRGESGTTRWHPNKSKIGGTLYRQCWYCNVLNDASREENVRLGIQIFRGFDSLVRAHLVSFDVHFQSYDCWTKERLLFDDCSRSCAIVSSRIGSWVSPVNEVSTVNDIVESRNLAGTIGERGEINWFTPHQPAASSPPPPLLSTPSAKPCWPGSTGERSSMKLFN